MSALRAGQLNRRITLQRPSSAQDSFGAVQSTWIDVATVWADIQPLSGRELENARRMASEVSQANRTPTRFIAGLCRRDSNNLIAG